ncbi:hypothetical protein JKG41_15310, partial [Acidithiobacillus sp. MC2.1]|uniref:hypothetical protein n=1 Tax=Acidithiobacillus sp. MC2.2 TaxID=2801579 RepID=UPI0019D0339B
MRFFFLCAGIPAEIFDAVRKEREYIGGTSTEVELLPTIGPWGAPYRPEIASRAIEIFRDRTAKEDASDDPSAYAVLYVPGANDDALTNPLFPSIYTCPVDWDGLIGYGKVQLSQSKNALVRLLNAQATEVRAAITALARAVKEQAQRTPWLLPVRNFRSGHLRGALATLQVELATSKKKPDTLKDLSNRFRQNHPPQKTSDGYAKDKSYFVDESGLEFKPPGHLLHGFHTESENSDHNKICYIASRRRLGTPYIKTFHYDCARGDTKPTHANLCNCHSDDRVA